MSGILDLHTLLALQQGWATYAASAANFAALFEGVAPSLLATWHADLIATAPTFKAHAATKKDGMPLVIVQLIGETLDNEPLGGFAYTDEANTRVEQLIVKQSVRLLILTKHPEHTRALFVVLRAVMQTAQTAFLRAGYLDLFYEGGMELATEEDLLAEQLGVFARQMTYSGRSMVTIPDPAGAAASQPWFVQAADITVDGHEGGVVPSVS